MSPAKPAILIVDDDPDFFQVISLYLDPSKYILESATTYAKAVEKIKENKYDLLILNVMLKGDLRKAQWFPQWTSLLGRAKRLGIRTVVVTEGFTSVGEDNITMESLARERFDVYDVIYKTKWDIDEKIERLEDIFVKNGAQNSHKIKKIKLLFLSANPKDTDRLRFDKEFKAIKKAVGSSNVRLEVEVISELAVSVDELSTYLAQHKPQIVHFSGHGTESGKLVFESQFADRKYVGIKPQDLRDTFKHLKDNIRCVFFSACYSEEQAVAVAQVVDCTIGVSNLINDDVAINFAAKFYEMLALVSLY